MKHRMLHVCWGVSITLVITVSILVMRQKQKNSLPAPPRMKQNSETLTSVQTAKETTVTATGGGVDTPTDQRVQCNTVLPSVTSISGCNNWMPPCGETCVKHSHSAIPKHVHFISVGHPFTLVEWLAVLTAKKWIKPDRITIYTDGEQDSCWWRRILPFIEHQLVHTQLGNTQMNNAVISTLTQVTDFLRLSILYNYGGIYIDTDALTVRSFDDLLSSQVVLARNCKGTIGNGVLLAQRHSCFICRLAHYSCTQFIGDGLTHSVYALTNYTKMLNVKQDGVNILPKNKGFFPNCGSRRAIRKLFHFDANLQSQLNFSDMYSLHLFHSSSYLHNTTIYNASWTRESGSVVARAIRRTLPAEIISEEYYDVQSCINKSFVL